jgi:hypothetical protein
LYGGGEDSPQQRRDSYQCPYCPSNAAQPPIIIFFKILDPLIVSGEQLPLVSDTLVYLTERALMLV